MLRKELQKNWPISYFKYDNSPKQKHKNINHSMDKYVAKIQKLVEDFKKKFQNSEKTKKVEVRIHFPFKKRFKYQKQLAKKLQSYFI